MAPIVDLRFAKWIEKVQGIELGTCSICVFEIEKGIALLPKGKRAETLRINFDKFLASLVVVDFDTSCAESSARLFAFRQLSGFNPKVEDMMIAGICATNGAVLITRNVKDFEGLPIEVVNPWI